ncbi:hypothetical protein [Bacillus manliponensis]|uniref:hypothetical protein n=1 Tax=Bacillus manliponensis TaxID=574376 RepID=UPI0035177D6E
MTILDHINEASELLLVLSAFCFHIYLWRLKMKRKLTAFEYIMFIVTQLAYLLWGLSFIAKTWG